MEYASIGVVSEGTTETYDLLQTFIDELEYHLKRQPRRFKRQAYRSLIRYGERAIHVGNDDDASNLVDELADVLDEFSPPYCHFGTAEGDGACYGYWPNNLGDYDGLRVNDLSEVPKNHVGELMVINDHGNVTFGTINTRGKFTAIWSCV